jgi:hypothetical protein
MAELNGPVTGADLEGGRAAYTPPTLTGYGHLEIDTTGIAGPGDDGSLGTMSS